MFCKNCGKQIPEDSIFCPSCGATTGVQGNMDNRTNGSQINDSKKRSLGIALQKIDPSIRKIISGALSLIAIILVVQGIRTVTSDDYDFYCEHYAECMEGYDDCKDEALTAGYLLRSTYERLADDYMKMAKEDQAKLWGMRMKAIVFMVVAVGVIVFAFYLFQIKENPKEPSSPPTTTKEEREE